MRQEELFKHYIEMAEIQMECTYSGDYKKGNKASDELRKYNEIIESNFQDYEQLVLEMLKSKNPNVIIWIASVAIDKNFEMKSVIEKLKLISANKDLGIIGFNAAMLLKTIKQH